MNLDDYKGSNYFIRFLSWFTCKILSIIMFIITILIIGYGIFLVGMIIGLFIAAIKLGINF